MMVAVLGMVTANAQDTVLGVQEPMCCKSKGGDMILPEAGEFSIGVDAVPVLNYFGNLFNKEANTAAVGYQQANTIVGTYMKTNKLAYRGKLRIGLNSSNVDSVETKSTDVTLGGGLMKYRGKGRLQGYYGAEVGVNITNGSVTTAGTTTDAPKGLGAHGRGFIGAQYFVAPKISIGTEYGWGPSYHKTGDNSTFSLDVDNMSGALYLSLFF